VLPFPRLAALFETCPRAMRAFRRRARNAAVTLSACTLTAMVCAWGVAYAGAVMVVTGVAGGLAWLASGE
jgi:hypothetical protein